MTKKERDKLYKIIEIFHNKYYEVNERNISDFYKEDTDFEELNIHWIEKWCDRLNISMTNTTFH